MKIDTSRVLSLTIFSLICAACQPQDGTTPGASQNAAAASPSSGPNFFEQLGNAVKQGVKDGINNGIQTSDSVGVLGYTMMPMKMAHKTLQPAYCLENPVTHDIITNAPMFGRPYSRGDGTLGFAQTTKQTSEHTGKIEVNLNGVLPGNTCADLIAAHKLIPGIAPDYYYNGGYSPPM